MKRSYLMDTGIAQDYQDDRGQVRSRAIAHRKKGHRIGICVPVLGELWAGVEYSSSRARNLKSLRQALSTLLIWPYSAEAAEAPLDAVAAQLRFRSSAGNDLLDIRLGKVNAQQLQTMRQLAPESASLLAEVWEPR